MSGSSQCGEEQTFSSENCRFDVADVFDVIVDTRLKCHKTTRVHSKEFAGSQVPFDQHAARMHKRPAIPLKALHNETFSAEKANTQPLLKCDTDAHTFCGGKKRILLSDQFSAYISQADRHNLPGS